MFAGSALTAVFIIASVCASSWAYECIYDDSGLCMSACPPDTVSYTSPCGTGMTKSQRTCRQPVARSIGMICDLSRCDCVKPKVWDEKAEKCVLLKDCSPQGKKTRPS